jgi:uncharacterized repeat protein (TIGR04076 family)
MHELWIEVERVDGACSGSVPMVPGTGFAVRGGRLDFPGGGPICLFALQNLLPLIPVKERLSDGDLSADWIGRVRHVQCPDPDGRVVWRFEQRTIGRSDPGTTEVPPPKPGDLVVRVEEIEGRCVEGTCVGDRALVRGSSIYLPQPFCLYAMAALLPLLPATQRAHEDEDWMLGETRVLCPDPQGNVIFHVERVPDSGDLGGELRVTPSSE